MLTVQSFCFNPFQENTYLIINETKHCWIVDPGMHNDKESQLLFNYIAQNELTPQAIINTHAHIDHVLGVNAVKEKYGIPFFLHELELSILQSAGNSAMLFGIPLQSVPVQDGWIKENEPLRLGNEFLEVRFAPGHSPGSIVFYNAQDHWVISGDVLFYGSIGRTDLPGGNYDTLMHSIQTQLLSLPSGTKVYPGHGPATTIGEEAAHNPFLNREA
jgi:hydroxyacylglutathione hydrolase